MGRPPQRAARLHFRAPGISGEDAHGPGSFEYWRARADGTGKRSAHRSRKSCSLARGAERRTSAGRCSVWRKSKSSFTENRFAFASRRVASNIPRFAGSKCIAFASGSSRSVSSFAGAKRASQSRPEGASRFALSSSSSGECSSSCISKSGRRSAAVASADERRATDVLRGMAPRPSVFAAQYQRRFGHAVLSFSLSNAAHH
jgi:hypothetical protein